jgi:hypothetical protein
VWTWQQREEARPAEQLLWIGTLALFERAQLHLWKR